jgi:hypothetical protein
VNRFCSVAICKSVYENIKKAKQLIKKEKRKTMCITNDNKKYKMSRYRLEQADFLSNGKLRYQYS